MNKALILTALLGVAALAGVLYTHKHHNVSFVGGYKYENEFKQFATQYQKQYGHDEAFYRYKNFEANMDIINDHNELYNSGKSTYFLGVNELADMDLAEFKSKYLGYKMTQKTNVNVSEKKTNFVAPTSVDWTTKGAVNPVKNQGQCGSCWAFSAVAALEGINFLTNGKLQSFAEQALVDCAGSYGNMGCRGGLMDSAFQYTQAQGLPLEADYAYTAQDGQCKQYTAAFKNGGYVDVTPKSESALVAAIAQQPVSVAIEADTSAFQLYQGGILNNPACGTQLDHGVTAVGYGAGFYKIRNSWGASWGEQGYVRLARTGDGAGMCGLQSQPSYPVA